LTLIKRPARAGAICPARSRVPLAIMAAGPTMPNTRRPAWTRAAGAPGRGRNLWPPRRI